MKLGNMKIGIRLGLGFGLILVLMVVIMLVGVQNMEEIQNKLDRIFNVNNVRIALANDMSNYMDTISLEMRNILLREDQSVKQDANNRIEAARIEYREAFNKLKEMDKTAEGKALLAKVEEVIENAASLNNKVIKLGLANKADEAIPILIKESAPAMVQVEDALKEIVKYQEGRNKFHFDEAKQAYVKARIIMFLAGGIAIALAIMITLFLVRSISKPVAELVKVAETASSGDLTSNITVSSRDEIGQLAGAFKMMINQMRELVRQIVEKATTVSASAQQLNSSSQQTTASANENAATMSEIATTVEQVTSNVQEISIASETATDHANEGNKGIARVTDQMQAITNSAKEVSNVINGLNKKSREINQIVELITGIADQTNLLALNAAIEAARAGEHGRGFAVVAEEVRKLAEQSANATKKIKNLINVIQVESQRAVESMAEGGREVEAGSKVVQEVGENFKEIISTVQGLTSQIQEVASATEQMSAGVQNVAASTEEQTAAMEEVSASAESLSSLADELNALVGKFKV